jgi:hypothetical protein
MPLADRLYEWLAAEPSTDADLILSAGLERAEPGYAERIEQTLLRRSSALGLAGLIRRWNALSETTRQALRKRPEQMNQGIAAALSGGPPEARLNALHAFEDTRPARLAYLLPVAMRDPSPRVRNNAAEVLYRTAVAFLQRTPPAPDADAAAAGVYAAERRGLAQAVREAVRTFDLHRRVEALEVGAWFSREIEGALWEQLDNPRSRARSVVTELLPSWNRPWLAGFLLEALTRGDWRVAALRRLSQWKHSTELLALLRESDALDNPEIARRLAAIRDPAWFHDVDTCIAALPGELRRHVPRWIRCLGLPDDTKLKALLACFQTGQEPVQRAALYALATLDRPETVDFFRRVAGSASPLATFAAWFVAGAAVRSGRDDSSAPGSEPASAARRAVRQGGDALHAAAPIAPAVLPVVNLIDQYRRLSHGFNQAPTATETWTFVLVVAGILAALILFARFVGRDRRAKPPPKVDYLTLAVDLLGLSELERSDLRYVAHHSRIDPPAAMLLSPANLAWAAHLALDRGGPPERRRRLEQLCLKLFEVPLPEVPRSQRPDKN